MKSARAAEANEKAAADIKTAADNLRKLTMVVLLLIWKFVINVTAGWLPDFLFGCRIFPNISIH
jgi:hypothetical protein